MSMPAQWRPSLRAAGFFFPALFLLIGAYEFLSSIFSSTPLNEGLGYKYPNAPFFPMFLLTV